LIWQFLIQVNQIYGKCNHRPLTFNPPRGDYSSQRGNDQAGTLRFKMEFTQGEYTGDAINQEVERNLKSIEDYIGWIKRDIESHNPQLQNEIRSKVAQRRERLGIIQSVSKALNIPIQTREGAPGLAQLPLKQKSFNRYLFKTIARPKIRYRMKIMKIFSK